MEPQPIPVEKIGFYAREDFNDAEDRWQWHVVETLTLKHIIWCRSREDAQTLADVVTGSVYARLAASLSPLPSAPTTP